MKPVVLFHASIPVLLYEILMFLLNLQGFEARKDVFLYRLKKKTSVFFKSLTNPYDFSKRSSLSLPHKGSKRGSLAIGDCVRCLVSKGLKGLLVDISNGLF